MTEYIIDTLVELYDPGTHIYNALGVLLFRPRRAVFIVPEHASAVFRKYKDAYRQLWSNRGCVPDETVFVPTYTSDIMELSEIIYGFAGDGAILDIEGGTPELYLAAGYVYGRSPDRFSCVRIDFADSKVTEYSRDGEESKTKVRAFTDEEKARLSLSVEECVAIYGGQVDRSTISELISRGMTREEIASDTALVWRAMMRRSRRTWNALIPDRVHVKSDRSLDIYINGNEAKIRAVSNLVYDLVSAGALIPAGGDPARRRYRCRSYAVLFALRKAGELLELYVNDIASAVSDSGAICGVSLSFDGDEGSAENEIDCIFTVGSTPVFISCKNGNVGSEELYKFAAVTRQFGGEERIAVLVAPALADGDDGMTPQRIKSVTERADLYGIRIITDICEVTRSEAIAELSRVISEKKLKKPGRVMKSDKQY